MHCAGAIEGGGGLDPQGGTRRSRVDTRGAGNCAKMVLHVTQAGRGLVRRQAGRVPRDPGRPGGQFLATGVLHLGHRVVRGQVRVAALCGVGARHRVQPGKEQRENGHSATHAGAHSSPSGRSAGAKRGSLYCFLLQRAVDGSYNQLRKCQAGRKVNLNWTENICPEGAGPTHGPAVSQQEEGVSGPCLRHAEV